jgi:flagellar basal body-associated protein FliL
VGDTVFWDNDKSPKSEKKMAWIWSISGVTLAFLGSIPIFKAKKSEEPNNEKKNPLPFLALLSLIIFMVLIIVLILALILWFIFDEQ